MRKWVKKGVKNAVFSGFEHFRPKPDPLFDPLLEADRIESAPRFRIGRFEGSEIDPLSWTPFWACFGLFLAYFGHIWVLS